MRLPMVRPIVQAIREGIISSAGGGNGGDPDDHFILTVRIVSGDETFTLPFQPSDPVLPWNALIDWGDASSDTITTYNDPVLAHPYPVGVSADYDITVSGSANCVKFATVDRLKLIDVKQWGRTGWTSCSSSFFSATNCIFTAGPISDTSSVTSMASMYQSCTVGLPDVSGFDTSSCTSLLNMFLGCVFANPDVSGFDIGLITSMSNMMFNTPFSDANFDAAIVPFNDQPHQSNVVAHFGSAQYSAGAPQTAHDALVNDDGWVITSNGLKP